MEQHLTHHRYQVLNDVSQLHQYAQTTKQHQKNIMELINDIDDNKHEAFIRGDYEAVIEYLQEEFLTHHPPDIKPNIKTGVSIGQEFYVKSDGKITKSKDAYEKSWIQQGYDYFAYYSDYIEKKEEGKVYRLLGWKVN